MFKPAREMKELRAKLAEQDNQIAQLNGKLIRTEQARDFFKAERDAAFVRGLERAQEMTRSLIGNIHTPWHSDDVCEHLACAIQAEIDKAKAGK